MKHLTQKIKLIALLVSMLGSVAYSYGQTKHLVKGNVADDLGAPLPGATIVEKGTTNGVSADFEGNYSLEVSDTNAIMVISYIGFEKQEVPVNGKSEINVLLQSSASALDEVVIIGYGTSKKSDVTGSLVRVDPGKTADLNNTNILQSLQGNVAGLSVGTPDRPGEAPSFQIRGVNSIGKSDEVASKNEPLIVVDGVIYNSSLTGINPADVASIDILKDASSAAVYGSRSANGVIIITTKKGLTDKPIFNFSTSMAVSDPVSLIPVLTPDQYLQKVLDVRVAQGQEADPNKISDYLNVTESNNLAAGRTVDWYDRLVKTSFTKTYSGSVSGQSKNTNYFMSGLYNTQEGIVANDNFDKISLRVNLSQNITDWFKLSLKTTYAFLDYSGVAVDLDYGLSPYSNYYKDSADSGELEYYPMEDPYFRHPYLNLEIDDKDTRNNIWGLISSEIKIPFVEGLKWTMNYSMSDDTYKKYQFSNSTLAIPENGEASKRIVEDYSWLFDNILNYDRVFGKHSVSGTFLISREYRNTSKTLASANDFFNQALGFNSLELGKVKQNSSAFGEQNMNAIMGRVGYVYDQRYAINATFRRDGYSGFSVNNKYANFLSGGFSWNIANENFLENSTWVDELKLRISYGENGNQAIGRYQTIARLGTENYVFGDGGSTSIGVSTSTLANNNLGWETTKVKNLGFDFSFFKSALSGSLDYYYSKTEDILLTRNIPALTGFNTVLTNIGRVGNKGFELALNARPYSDENFSWNIGVTFDLNRNEIESLFGVDDDGDGKEDDDIANAWFIGKPFGAIYGYETDGIYQTGEADIPSGYQPGDFRIVDYDNDGELTADDRHILGYSSPNYTFGISNTFVYKNWSLYAMLNSIQGGGEG